MPLTAVGREDGAAHLPHRPCQPQGSRTKNLIFMLKNDIKIFVLQSLVGTTMMMMTTTMVMLQLGVIRTPGWRQLTQSGMEQKASPDDDVGGMDE